MIFNTFYKSLPFLILIFFFGIISYGVGQQVTRASANNPQIQLAEDTAQELTTGTSAAALSLPKIDIAQSVSPYVIVYDKAGHPTFSTGTINGKIPTLPPGITKDVSQKGELRFSWETKEGIRSAAVLVPYSKGYVLSGRSLREVEKQEQLLLMKVIVGMFFSASVLIIYFAVVRNFIKNK